MQERRPIKLVNGLARDQEGIAGFRGRSDSFQSITLSIWPEGSIFPDFSLFRRQNPVNSPDETESRSTPE